MLTRKRITNIDTKNYLEIPLQAHASLPDYILPVDLPKAYRLINHGPTVLVSSAHAGKQNVMAAAWNMGLDFEPAKVCVVIDKSTLTRTLIEQSGEFVLSVPSRAIAKQTLQVGGLSGRETDKFEKFNVSTYPGQKMAAPLIAGSVAWLECQLISEPHNQTRYDLFIGEVIAAHADSRVFRDGHWQYTDETDPNLQTLHYIAGSTFLTVGNPFTVT
jgi:flavin reductase (DIM6/NTAB) family NADH-FMN oxidoreductase RutF